MNLLRDPMFQVDTVDGRQSMNLPQLMTALGQDEVDHLVDIQRHQEDAFHVFLCYLAGAVLARRGDHSPFQDERYWLEGLRELAGPAGDDAWTLVVHDLSLPAFMQPPLPQADQGKLSLLASSSDGLDLLPTAKNHDVKQARTTHPQADEWIYALVSLQTMSGFFGRGNPGISRMNSGFGNRPTVEVVRSVRPGIRWHDAVLRLATHRAEILRGAWGYDPEGLVLVWTENWDGDTSLPLSRLDPFYVEICRRVRLRGGGDHVSHVDAIPSNANRVAAKELKGVVGDAWLPVDQRSQDGKPAQEQKALTVSSQGFTPDILRRLLFADELKTTVMQKPPAEWKEEMWLLASVLVRGQGKTDGFYERRIPIPPLAQPRLFGPPSRRDPLRSLGKAAIDYAGKMHRSVLRQALFVYFEGAPDKLQFDRDSAQAWWRRWERRFNERWSADYFPWLWSAPEPLDEFAVLTEWAIKLRDHALSVLHEAEDAMPQHAGRRYRVRVEAEHRFWAALYNKSNFPDLRPEPKEESHGRVARN